MSEQSKTPTFTISGLYRGYPLAVSVETLADLDMMIDRLAARGVKPLAPVYRTAPAEPQAAASPTAIQEDAPAAEAGVFGGERQERPPVIQECQRCRGSIVFHWVNGQRVGYDYDPLMRQALDTVHRNTCKGRLG